MPGIIFATDSLKYFLAYIKVYYKEAKRVNFCRAATGGTVLGGVVVYSWCVVAGYNNSVFSVLIARVSEVGKVLTASTPFPCITHIQRYHRFPWEHRARRK